MRMAHVWVPGNILFWSIADSGLDNQSSEEETEGGEGKTNMKSNTNS